MSSIDLTDPKIQSLMCDKMADIIHSELRQQSALRRSILLQVEDDPITKCFNRSAHYVCEPKECERFPFVEDTADICTEHLSAIENAVLVETIGLKLEKPMRLPERTASGSQFYTNEPQFFPNQPQSMTSPDFFIFCDNMFCEKLMVLDSDWPFDRPSGTGWWGAGGVVRIKSLSTPLFVTDLHGVMRCSQPKVRPISGLNGEFGFSVDYKFDVELEGEPTVRPLYLPHRFMDAQGTS